MLNRTLFLVVFLVSTLITFFPPGDYFSSVGVFAAGENVPWFLIMNMSSVIDKKAIEAFAEKNSWEKTSSLARNEAMAYYGAEKEPWEKKIIGTLWTPTVLWIELRKNAELSRENREKAEEEYRNHEWIFNLGVKHFTLDLYGETEKKVSPENLQFILMDSHGNSWEAETTAQIEARGIEQQTSSENISYYKNIIDLFFMPSSAGANNWQGSEKLTLQTVYRDSNRAVKLEWEPAYNFCIEEQFDYHFQNKLGDFRFNEVFSRAFEVLDKKTDISDSIDISLVKPERFHLQDNLFLVGSRGEKENFLDLFVEIIDYFPDGKQFFIQVVKNFTTSWNIFAVWHEGKGKFRPIASDYQPTAILPYYLTFKPIELEQDLKGIVLDTSFRHRMSYVVLMYDEKEGYKKAWDFSGEGFLYIDYDQAGLVKHHEFSAWDDSFPKTLRGYPTSFFPEVLRVKEHTYLWNKENNTFNEIEQQEIFSRVAVINHFLKALKEGNTSHALEFIKDGVPLREIIKEEKICLLEILDVNNTDIFIYKIDGTKLGAWDLPQVDFLEKIDLEPTGRPIVIMALAKQKENGADIPLSPEDIIKLAVWEFSHSRPWKITSMIVYKL